MFKCCYEWFYFFRNLKTLDIYSDVASAFVNCKNLETLSMSVRDGASPSTLVTIKTCLKNNKKLKNLTFHHAPIFNEDFSSEISFKLTKFSFNFWEKENQQRNLNFFLKTQKDTLEDLTIDYGQRLGEKTDFVNDIF